MKRLLPLIAVSLCAAHAEEIGLFDLSRLDLKNATAAPAMHKGAQALKVTETAPGDHSLVIIKDLRFHNGTIDLQVSGAPSAAASGQARGFIGVAFRVQPESKRYEHLYIRPTNGRADDQLRRNHSTQYTSYPEWPWERLRKESPGVYESYADMMPGDWIRLRIVVQGTRASLFVGDAGQPCLIVKDLKLGDTEGGIALWIGPGTEGYFRALQVSAQ